MNLYGWPTPKPAPKPTRHQGLDKSYEWGRANWYELKPNPDNTILARLCHNLLDVGSRGDS